jgi:hypothetical protein
VTDDAPGCRDNEATGPTLLFVPTDERT